MEGGGGGAAERVTIYIYTCIYIYIYACINMYVYMSIYIYILYIYMHAYVHRYTHMFYMCCCVVVHKQGQILCLNIRIYNLGARRPE